MALGPAPTSFPTPVSSGLSKSWRLSCRGSDMVPAPATGPARHLRLLPFLAFLCRPIRLLHRCRLTCTSLPKSNHQNKPYILWLAATLKRSTDELHIVYAEELYIGSICSQVSYSTDNCSHSDKALSLRGGANVGSISCLFCFMGRVGWTKHRTAPISK